MDESTNESVRTQLVAFVREIGIGFGITEELIGLMAMKNVATGVNSHELVKNALHREQLEYCSELLGFQVYRAVF
jgi:hypothetical protein